MTAYVAPGYSLILSFTEWVALGLRIEELRRQLARITPRMQQVVDRTPAQKALFKDILRKVRIFDRWANVYNQLV